MDVVRSSRAVLDIQHFKQTGLTMRTLETLGAGKKLITTNPDVKEYDFYDEGRVMTIDRANPAAALNLEFFREDDSQVPEAVIDGYSIAVGTLRERELVGGYTCIWQPCLIIDRPNFLLSSQEFV